MTVSLVVPVLYCVQMARPSITGTANIYNRATWVVIGETFTQRNHIIEMSIKLIEHTRKEIRQGLVFRAVGIELSSIERTI